ncbi:MAG: hypothetical protein RL353_1059 [Actinomycetota bacterium]|jgi:YggT family protein
MRTILCNIVSIFTMMIIVRVVLSWFPSTSGGLIAQVSYYVGRATEPVLNAVRQRLPRVGSLDLSPLVVLLFLQIVVQGMILKC